MRSLPKKFYNNAILLHDTLLAGASFIVALYLRWGSKLWVYAEHFVWQGTFLCAGVVFMALWRKRLYRRVWRYLSAQDLLVIAQTLSIALLVFYLILFQLTRLETMPRSVLLIHWLVLLAMICAPRFLVRVLRDRSLAHTLGLQSDKRIPVLLVGANDQAEVFIRESMRSSSFPYEVVGVVDDEPAQRGRDIHGIRIYGNTEDIPAVLRKLARKEKKPQRMIVTHLNLEKSYTRHLLDIASAENMPLARMPRLTDFKKGDADRFDIRPIDIEDILGRSQANLDREAMQRVVEGQCVLVTGAGGSIGSELVRQIAALGPERMVLLDASEYNLYRIDLEMNQHWSHIPHQAVLADVRNAVALEHIFEAHQPTVVFHAAALKHVPLSEANPEETVLTNIMGSQNVADMCRFHKARVMVQISTDKAVNPTNIMGASKRVAESYAQMLGDEQGATRFITVRFGNVLGSTGSVVPLFQEQLRRGGPITVTHKDMTRYFMTIKEAVQLVIQAAALGLAEAEPRGLIYVLDMGEPMKIEDLAIQMIRLAGLRPHEDIKIVYTGLRPGEKLYEELFHDAESLLPTAHASIRLAAARSIDKKALMAQLQALYEAAQRREAEKVQQALRALVPEYQPQTQAAA